MFDSGMYPPITLITGPRKSGRTTYAALICADFYRQGSVCFHNGTLLFSQKVEEYADTPDGLLKLAESIPGSSVILVEEADAQESTRQTDEPSHEAAINVALRTLAQKSCHLILTTVHGNERLIAKPLLKNASEHVTPFMEVESLENMGLVTMHRVGRYMVPIGPVYHDRESVLSAMALADTFRETRSGALEGREVNYARPRFFEVLQTSIDRMDFPKHPEYPVYYRHRIVRPLPNGNVHRLTQDAILNFTWLESVNEHPNETIILDLLERIMPQWGFEYQPEPTAQDTNFPDGRAYINGELVNLEIVSIQPRYPGGHNLHHLVALTQAGRAERPVDTVILKCQTCRTTERIDDVTLKNLPDHDERHLWLMYIPGSLYAPDFPFDLAATPLLTINRESFTNDLERLDFVHSSCITDGVDQSDV